VGESARTPSREQTRACHPRVEGYVERDGVRIFYEVYGQGDPVFLLLPTWEIVHSRAWKCQIPYFARHGTVVTFDPRGNGRSDRPLDVHAYDRREIVGDALAVLDQAGVERVVLVSWCNAGEELILAAEHPDRVARLVSIAPGPSAHRRAGGRGRPLLVRRAASDSRRVGEVEPALLA